MTHPREYMTKAEQDRLHQVLLDHLPQDEYGQRKLYATLLLSEHGVQILTNLEADELQDVIRRLAENETAYEDTGNYTPPHKN